MRPNTAVYLLSLLLTTAAAGVIDPVVRSEDVALVNEEARQPEAEIAKLEAEADPNDEIEAEAEVEDIAELEVEIDERVAEELWKRRGGGGGGGRGGSSGGSSKGGSSSGGSRGSSSSSSGSSRGSSSSGKGTNTKSNSNDGGYSKGGTGPQPSFPGNRYAGGASVPFKSGATTKGGLGVLGGAAVGGTALAFWPGTWHYPVFMYGPYAYHHSYYNKTSKKDEKRQIICGCEEYSVCMCDEVDDKEFWNKLIGDGDYSKLNKSVVTVSKKNGNETILINGTLPNGTTVNSDDPEDYEKYLVNAAVTAGKFLGLWPAIGAVMGAVFLL